MRLAFIFVLLATSDLAHAASTLQALLEVPPGTLFVELGASRNGRWVGIYGPQVVPGEYHALLDRQTGALVPVFHPQSGAWDYVSEPASIDDAGAIMTFVKGTPQGGSPPPGTLVLQRATGLEIDVSTPVGGGIANGDSGGAIGSADGRYVVFNSLATNLLPDANPFSGIQVYRRDLLTNELRLITRTQAGTGASGYSFASAISADGRFVALQSDASDLVAGDGNGTADVFLWDAVAGTIERVSVSSAGGEAPQEWPTSISVCDDGSRVAWSTNATGLVPGDQTGTYDVYLRDRGTGATRRVNENASGLGGNAGAHQVKLSGDCSTVVFASAATNLGTVVPAGVTQVWVRELGDPEPPELASADRFGVPGDAASNFPWLSPDGREVLFASGSRNWRLDGGGRSVPNVFVRTRGAAIFGDDFEG